MTHKSVVDTCEALGLKVWQGPDTERRAYNAVSDTPGTRVHWTTSYEGLVVGLPRVIVGARDTHARTMKEIRYLVKG